MKIEQYVPGTKIAKPGIYSGVPIDVYHHDLCEGPSVSSSGLRTIESKTPLHYYATSYLNPNRAPEEQKDHFNFGRAAHTLLLGEGGFREQYAVRPDEWSDWRTKAAQEWRREQIAAGKCILTPNDLSGIKGVAEVLAEHPLIRAGLLQGKIEHSIACKDEATGVWLKSRPDVVPEADSIIVDLKTTTDASPEAVQRTITSFNYPMQGALVAKTLKAAAGIQMSSFVLAFVEKTPPYAVNIVEVDGDWIAYASRQLRRAIDTFAKCVESGHWPGYEHEGTAYMPEWLRRRMDQDSDVGLLPREAA